VTSIQTPEIAETHNPGGKLRILVTKRLPGERWKRILADCGCRVDILGDNGGYPLREEALRAALERDSYTGAIGQLNEPWRAPLLEFAHARGLRYYSNYAVGYDNLDLEAASRLGILAGNTPGALTAATAELAVALTFAAARRVAEMDALTRRGEFTGWLPWLGAGRLLEGRTVGLVGAGRIGRRYAEKMAGAGCSILYYSRSPQPEFEGFINALGETRRRWGRPSVGARRVATVEELLAQSDVVSLHCPLTPETRGLLNRERLALMKPGAILINTARGPVVEESALVEALREGRLFAAGLDVYENEPALAPGLAQLPNTVLLPHIGSATDCAREAMAILAAANLRGMIRGFPPCPSLEAMLPEFLAEGAPPDYCPSVLNFDRVGPSPATAL